MARGKGKGNAGITNNPVTGTGANDVLAGSAAIINGGDGDDQITGSDLVERINGGDGDDFIFGGGGDDTIFGNDGTDTAVYTGSLQDAVLEAGKGNSYTLTSVAGGTDTLKHIEFIQFDDFTYEVGVNNGVFTRADSAATDEDTAITIDALANDFNFEGDSFSVTSFDSTSAHGASVSLVNGEFAYDSSNTQSIQDLNDGESITDSFTYTVTDDAGNETTETVTVDVAGVSDSVILDFDSGTNYVWSDWGYGMNGAYHQDGFTVTWQTNDWDYYYWYTNDADNPVQDLNWDGDNELGVEAESWYWGGEQLWATLSKDDGSTFSIQDFDVVNDGGSDYYAYWNSADSSYSRIVMESYTYNYSTNQWDTYVFGMNQDNGWDSWYSYGVNDDGNWVSGWVDTETFADTYLQDINYLSIYIESDEWFYWGNANGIGIDNIEIA